MAGPETVGLITAIGSLAGGGASIASATKGQNQYKPSGQPGVIQPPELQQPALPRLQANQPQVALPQTNADYDRNLLSILSAISKGQ